MTVCRAPGIDRPLARSAHKPTLIVAGPQGAPLAPGRPTLAGTNRSDCSATSPAAAARLAAYQPTRPRARPTTHTEMVTRRDEATVMTRPARTDSSTSFPHFVAQ